MLVIRYFYIVVLLLLPLPTGIKYCSSSILNKSICQINSICFVLIACNETSDRDRDNWRLVCRCQCLSSSKPQCPDLPVAHIISSIRALFPPFYRGGRTHCDMLLLQHPALTETCCTVGSIYRKPFTKTSKLSSFTLTLMITDSCCIRIIREIYLKSEQQLRTICTICRRWGYIGGLKWMFD